MIATPSTVPPAGGTVTLSGTVVADYTNGAWLMQIAGPTAFAVETTAPCASTVGRVCNFSDTIILSAHNQGAIYTFALYPWVDVGGSGTPAVVSIVQEDGGPGPG